MKACFGFIGILLLNTSLVLAEQSWDGHLIVKYRYPPSALGGNARSLDRKGKLQRVSVRAAARSADSAGSVLEPLSTYNNECAAFTGPNVEHCEPDVWINVQAVPTDPSYSQMTALTQIKAAQAWDFSVGSKDVVVAVMDTGIDLSHPDLTANVWTNPDEIADGYDNDGNGLVDDINGYDFFNKDSSAFDDNGHGTHVAGTIGAVGNNGIGVVGVAYGAALLPIKFLGSGGGGPLSNALTAMDYLISLKQKHNIPLIVNASWGGDFFSAALEDGIQEMGAAGILFVAAAGNSGADSDLVLHSPSGLNSDNIISVAAVDSKGARAIFSNYGYSTVDVAAPGTSILSTLPNGGYGALSGTSMATPHVAGVAALLWALQPTLTNLQVKDQILNMVSPGTLPTVTGGIVDAYAVLTGIVSAPPAQPVGDLKITEIRDRESQALDELTPGRPFSLRVKSDSEGEDNVLIAAAIYGEPCPTHLGSVQFSKVRRVRGRLPRKLVKGSVQFTVTNAFGSSDSRTARIRSKAAAKQKSKKAIESKKARILEEELGAVCEKLALSLR